jgi:N6-adenosine-specific RNA methylase IME4
MKRVKLPPAFHPLANIFPLLEGEEFAALVEDIRVHKLHEAIVLYQNKILDGRNRYRACSEAAVVPRYETYTGSDPLAYVVSKNLKRRHLSESQRAMVAAKLATYQHGGDRRSDQAANLQVDRPAAARLLNVSERSVASAADVHRHGDAALVRAVEAGSVKVSIAASIATLPKQQQRELLTRMDSREVLRAARDIRAQVQAQRRNERFARLTAISSSPLPTGQRYPVLLADPAHRFIRQESNGAAENHYATMSIEEICALPVADLATPDAILFLWTPAVLLLDEARRILDAWGFTYVTDIVWVKDKVGLGSWVRMRHEHLLIAIRGNMPTPATENRPPSVIEAPRREHSRKPDKVYALIDRMYPPPLPRIELFARYAREGWACWGAEAPTAVAPVMLEAAE